MAAGGSTKVVVAALLANAGIAVIKGVAAFFTGSGALLAEAIHSVADSGNQALLLLGARRAKRPPDARHPFGYGSERYFWAFVVALVLFALGSLFSLYEGVHKIRHPEPLRNVAWAYGVLAAALGLEAVAFTYAMRATRAARGGRGFWRFFHENKDPALPIVFLEDLGALLGLVIALGGIATAHITGFAYADGIATVLVGLLLGAIAAVLLGRCYRFLIGESAAPGKEAAIRAAVQSVGEVAEVKSLKTLHIGPETLLVAMELRFAGGPETVRRVEEATRTAVPEATYVHIEPA